mmetsp:Transcript_4759/g.14109  ORF Transcript_4759/g.14109 Transcript_4759/m.14109 type:complete len:249 (+) Transcript_4759:1060-1806(+)
MPCGWSNPGRRRSRTSSAQGSQGWATPWGPASPHWGPTLGPKWASGRPGQHSSARRPGLLHPRSGSPRTHRRRRQGRRRSRRTRSDRKMWSSRRASGSARSPCPSPRRCGGHRGCRADPRALHRRHGPRSTPWCCSSRPPSPGAICRRSCPRRTSSGCGSIRAKSRCSPSRSPRPWSAPELVATRNSGPGSASSMARKAPGRRSTERMPWRSRCGRGTHHRDRRSPGHRAQPCTCPCRMPSGSKPALG